MKFEFNDCVFVGYAERERGGKPNNDISCTYFVVCLGPRDWVLIECKK